MDSINIEYEDLFDDDDDGDYNDGDAVPENTSAMPAASQDEAGDPSLDQQVQKKLKEIASAVVKKRIQRPLPKLDSSRLTGERGLATLPKLFKDVKFRGRGHEVEDLNTMMHVIEHWAHRLYPKLSFDEIISKIETLGSRKAVQTYVNRIRLDLENVGVSTDYVDNRDSDHGPDQPAPLSFDAAQAVSEDSPFDDLSMGLQSSFGAAHLPTAEPAATEKGSDVMIESSDATIERSVATSETVTLTDEQRARIQRNKEAALQKRKTLASDDML